MKIIHIFPHSRIEIPEFVKPYLRDDLKDNKIEDILVRNSDTGYGEVIDKLEVLSKDNSDLEVFAFPYTRVVVDINRIIPEHQTPDKVFYGEQIYKPTAALRLELQSLVKDYQRSIIDSIVQGNTMIVHWHSMDKFSTGNINLKGDSKGEKRPAGQIMTRIDSRTCKGFL